MTANGLISQDYRDRAVAFAEPHVETWAEAHGIDRVDYLDRVRRHVADLTRDVSGVAIRFPNRQLRGFLLDDCRFLRRSELHLAGPSHRPKWASTKNPPRRLKREREVFDAEPIYGYLFTEGEALGLPSMVQEFGEIRVELTDDVRERTTFTVGDSELGDHQDRSLVVPSPLAGDVNVYACHFAYSDPLGLVRCPSGNLLRTTDNQRLRELVEQLAEIEAQLGYSTGEPIDLKPDGYADRLVGVLEAQVLGDLDRRHVARITFPHQPGGLIRRLLREQEIPWTIDDRRWRYRPPEGDWVAA